MNTMDAIEAVQRGDAEMSDLEALKRFVRDVEAGRFRLISMRHYQNYVVNSSETLGAPSFGWTINYVRTGEVLEGEVVCEKMISGRSK